MGKIKESTVIFLLMQICWAEVTDANNFGSFGDRIAPKPLKTNEKETENHDTFLSRRGGENTPNPPREGRGVMYGENKNIENDNSKSSVSESRTELNVESDSSTNAVTEVYTTISDYPSRRNGAQPTLSPFERRQVVRNRYSYLPRRPTRLRVPPVNLKKNSSETETESDAREIPRGQQTWQHLLHSKKSFESRNPVAENEGEGSSDALKKEEKGETHDENSMKETKVDSPQEEQTMAVFVSDSVKVDAISQCTDSEGKNCKQNESTRDNANQSKRKLMHGAEGRSPENLRQQLTGNGSTMKLHVHGAWNQPSVSISPVTVNGRSQLSRDGEHNSILAEVREVLDSPTSEKAKPNRNTDIFSRARTDSLTMTPRPSFRNPSTTSNLITDNRSSLSPISLTPLYVHLDTSNFVTTPGPLASHRLEDWLENTTDTGWLHLKTTESQLQPKTYGAFTLPPAPPQFSTESSLMLEQRSRDDNAEEDVLQEDGGLTSQSSEKFSTIMPFSSGFANPDRPKLSEYFNDHRFTSKPYQRPTQQDNTDMHIYNATQDIIQKAELEERRKALFSSVRTSTVRQRLVTGRPDSTSAQESDTENTDSTNGTKVPLKSLSFEGTRDFGPPSHQNYPNSASTSTPSMFPVFNSIQNETVSSIATRNQRQKQYEENNDENFIKGYLMGRENPASKPSADEEFHLSSSHSQDMRVSSPNFHRHRLTAPKHISDSNGKEKGEGLTGTQDTPSTFRPYNSYLRNHGIVNNRFDGFINTPNPSGNLPVNSDNTQNKKVQDNGLLYHSILRERPVEKESTIFKILNENSQQTATSEVAFQEPPSGIDHSSHINQRQQNHNKNFELFRNNIPSSAPPRNQNQRTDDIPRTENNNRDLSRVVNLGGVPVGVNQHKIIQHSDQANEFQTANEQERYGNNDKSKQLYNENDQTRIANHRPLPQPLPPFNKENDVKDEFLRSSFIIFTPPGKVTLKPASSPDFFSITPSPGTTFNPTFPSYENLPEPIHASSQENQVIVRGADKFRTFSPQSPSSIIPVPPIYYPRTKPSNALTSPAVVYPTTPIPDKVTTYQFLPFQSHVKHPQESFVRNTPDNTKNVNGATSHFSQVHVKDPHFVDNNDFHGLINFELQKSNANTQAVQGSSTAQPFKTTKTPHQSFGEVKGSSVLNLGHNLGTVEPTIHRQKFPHSSVSLPPHLGKKDPNNIVAQTNNPLNDYTKDSEFLHHIKDLDNDIPGSFVSFEVAQFLDRDKRPVGKPVTSHPNFNVAEYLNIQEEQRNKKIRDSRENPIINLEESQEHLTKNIKNTQINQENVHSHPNQDSRIPEQIQNESQEHLSQENRDPHINQENIQHFLPDSRLPEHSQENSRPQFITGNRIPQPNQDDRIPHFITGNRRPGSSEENRRPNFNQNNRRPESSEENRRPNFSQNNRRPQFSQEVGRPNFHQENRRPHFSHGNRRPNFSQENKRPFFNQNGRPLHGSSEFEVPQQDPENNVHPSNIPIQAPNFRHHSSRPLPLHQGFVKPPPNHLRPPPYFTNSAENSNQNGNEQSLNNVNSNEDELLTSSESLRHQQEEHDNSHITSSENPINSQDHNNFPTPSSNENFPFRDHQLSTFPNHDDRPSNNLPPFLAPPHHPHFLPPSSTRSHGNHQETLRPPSHTHRHHNPQLRQELRPIPLSPPPPLPPPPFPPTSPKSLLHHRHPPPPIHGLNQIRNSNKPPRHRPLPQATRHIRPFTQHSAKSEENFHKNHNDPRESSDERPFQQSINHPNSLEKENIRFPSSHEMENDFTPMRGVSQPLPEDSNERKIRMSESHAKLLENMRYGIDGKPLDVWIPIISKDVSSSGEGSHRDHKHRPHDDKPHRDRTSTQIHDDYDYHDSHEREHLKNLHGENDDYDYHVVQERDFEIKAEMEFNIENGGRGESTEHPSTNGRPVSPTHGHKEPRYNVINFPNVNIVSSVR